MDASQVPESRRRPPQNTPHAEHPREALNEFQVRLIAAALAGRGAADVAELEEVVTYLDFLVEDFRRLQAVVQLWFQQNCPDLGLDMDTAPAGPTHVSQVLADLDSRAHVLTIRELAARIFNVRLDLEEATAYDFDIEEGGDPTVANLEHLEAAVDRARAALTVIARDLLLSVGIPPENGGGHV